MSQHSSCANCGNQLNPGYQFCPVCGQTAHVHRFTIGHILHEFFHAFTHADKSIFSFTRDLAVKPGLVAAEYVAGKRKKYFNPFTYLLICIAIFALLNNTFRTYQEEQAKPDPNIVAAIKDESVKRKYIASMERAAKASKFVTKNSNIVTMIALPLYAFIFWLFFRKRGRNYAEMLVASVMFIAFGNLLFTIIAGPLMSLTKGTNWYFRWLFIGLLLQLIYFAKAFSGFLHMRTFWGRIKVAAVSLFTVGVWTVITIIGFIIYVAGISNFPAAVKSMFVRH